MNVRPFVVAIAGLLILFIAPILIGLFAMPRRRFALQVFAAWLLMSAYAMFVSFLRHLEFATADAANQLLLHTPVQVAFNIAFLMLLAAPFFFFGALVSGAAAVAVQAQG